METKILANRKLTAGLLALVFLYQTSVAYASLQNEMQNMFDTMMNVTDGGYHRAMGRGVVAGPSVVMRNNRVRTDILNFVPPSIDAGCGGIDMFLGSFSFIDAEHFVNLLQAIAANAAGYAFQLALDTMCPTCGDAIKSLQKVMQALNALAGDSCKAAQFLVDTAADKLGTTELGRAMEHGPLASLARQVGAGADAFATYLNKVNEGASNRNLSDDQVKALLGNAAWKALKQNGYVSSAFISGDNDLAEALMSVTGTVVGVRGSGDSPEIHYFDPLLDVKAILKGTDYSGTRTPRRYHCLDADCLEMTQVNFSYEGLEKMVAKILLGSNLDFGTDSFGYKLLTNTGSLTEQEKQLIRVAPYHMTRIRNIAVCAGQGSTGSLEPYVTKASRFVALEVLDRYLKDAIAAISQATQGSGQNVGGTNVAHALMPKYQAMIAETRKAVREEQEALEQNLTGDLEKLYQGAVSNCNLIPAYIINPASGK